MPDLLRIARLWHQGRNTSEIAKTIDPWYPEHKVFNVLPQAKAVYRAKYEKPCKVCGAPVLSDHRDNQICGPCRMKPDADGRIR
ncbi:MAG: hypothetical protein ACR2QF_00345 [Geminicoccaceae bacterium]